MVMDAMKAREQAALQELAKLIKDKNAVPINYNHYYTDNLHKARGKRLGDQLEKHAPAPPIQQNGPKCSLGNHYYQHQIDPTGGVSRAVSKWTDEASADMEEFSCEEALDCLKAIYKVQQKVFVANVTVQVIERHLLADLNEIFSPMVLLNMSDDKVQIIVSERESTKRQRIFLTDRITKLEQGQRIFRGVLGS
ncbi:hypothetical protein KVR01_010475 [Diaporthe batatas]|uniref:uncharacterized protein n=1 Tax=Diaporthe batatas TaxID=748121 RepID=UPI001D05A064|nr:uncharacterized protein KVR01_010475 [Diaporthe batatas]KAG8159838.1 hypothetical protein KVR01_010475 [Diaporthe batatas]